MIKKHWPLIWLLIIILLIISTFFYSKKDKDYQPQELISNLFQEIDFSNYINKYHLENGLSDTQNILCIPASNVDLSKIPVIYEKLGMDIYTYQLCYSQGNYYLTYNAPEKYTGLVNVVKAGSGKIPTYISKIDSDGNIKTIENVESAISESFTELSFYFSCTEMVGSQGENTIILECSGSEGPEITRGLIIVNFDNNKSEYLNYCINPIESKTEYKDIDPNYTCFEKGKKEYFKGKLLTE